MKTAACSLQPILDLLHHTEQVKPLLPQGSLCLFPLAPEQPGFQTSRGGHGLFVDTQEADAAKAALIIVRAVFSFLFESDGEESRRRRGQRTSVKKTARGKERKQKRKEDHLSSLTKGICIRPALGAEQLL